MLNFSEELKKREKELYVAFTSVLIEETQPVRRERFRRSNLIKTLKVVVGSSDIQVIAQDYIENLDRGRKPLTKKIPISALLSWLQELGLPRSNSMAFRIQNSIYKKGIRGRNFIEKAFTSLEKEVGKILDETFNKIQI